MAGRSYADEPDLCELWLQLNADDDEQQQPAAPPNAAAADAPAPVHQVVQGQQQPPPADAAAAPPALQQPQQEEEELPPPEPEPMQMMMGDMAPEPEPVEFEEQADIEDFLGGIFDFWDDGGEDQDLPAVVVPGAGNMVEPPPPPPPAAAHPIIIHMHAADPDMEEMRRFILDAGEDACNKLPKPIRQFCYNRPPFNKFLAMLGKQNGKIKRLANVAKHSAFVTAEMRRLMEEYLGQKAEIIARLEDGMNKEKCKNNFPASGRRGNNGGDGPSGGSAGAGAAAMA